MGEPRAPHASGDTTAAAPDRERIAERAYELYLERGGGDGHDMDDWLNAEREVKAPGNGDRRTAETAAVKTAAPR